MLSAFVVLVRPANAANLLLQGVAAPDAALAMAAVSKSLREGGQPDSLVVGVFRPEDHAVLGQLFEQLDATLQR